MLPFQYKSVLVVQNSTERQCCLSSTNLYWWYKNQDLNLFSTNTVCVLKSTSVVCINPSDAYNYLANSYRPYQLRNNKLAATYDGAHGQGAKARDGCFLQRHGGDDPSPLT